MANASAHIPRRKVFASSAATQLLAFARLALISLGPWLLPLALIVSAHAQDGGKEFHHDFRGRPLPAELELFQVDNPDFVQSEPAGLRITLPKTYQHRPGGVGCQRSSRIQGDFDVTATVEFLDVERPSAAFAGVGLSVEANRTGVQLRRGIGAMGRQTLVSRWHFPAAEKEAPQWKQKITPCVEKSVKLRLKRIGATVHYLWAPGAGEDFEDIHQVDFGNDDIEFVRLFAFNNQHPCLVDVRLIDLRIRSTGQAVAPVIPAPKSETKGWLAAALISGVGMTLLLGIGIGALLIWRRRRSAGVESK